MQQRFRKLALFIGASSLLGAGFIVACGTDNGTVATPLPDAGGGGKDGSKTDTGTTTDDDGGTTETDGSSTVDCSTAPALRTNTTAGGFFCAFYKAEAGVDGAAGLSNCTADQTCCNPGIADGGAFAGKFPPAFCANGKNGEAVCAAQDTANGSDYQPGFFSQSWECNDRTACASGEICVMFTSAYVAKPTDKVNVGVDTKAPAACHEYKAYKQGGSKCIAEGAFDAANQVRLCSKNDPGNCGAGTSCQPFDGNGRDLGSCR